MLGIAIGAVALIAIGLLLAARELLAGHLWSKRAFRRRLPPAPADETRDVAPPEID
jgi:hypothetical protein